MQPTTDQIILFRRLYLGHEPQRHAVMNQPEAEHKYTTIHRPIRDQHITAHLRGFLTLAAPLIGPDGRAQAVALDIDSGGRDAVQRALDTAQALGWIAYGITSVTNKHDGGHLWIHLDAPAAPARARLLAQQIAETAGIQAETYPKHMQLRLPLGKHRWTEQRGILLLQDGTTLDLDSDDQAILEALARITALPRNPTEHLPELPPQPRPARSLHTPVQAPQKPAGSARDAIQAFNQATDLIGLLENYGARIAEMHGNGGAVLHCPCGRHAHGDRRPSLLIQPARSSHYGRFVVFGYSPACQFYTERGQVFAAFDVLCRLEGLTPVAALKRINPCRPEQPTRRRAPYSDPDPEPDWRELTPEERAETDAQRQARIAQAHAIHAELRARMEADRELSPRARSVLDVLLSWDVNRAWCRISTARIAKDHLQVSERTVQRGMRELERRGYIQSDTHTTRDGQTYQGGWSTTIRRFLRVTPQAPSCHPCIKLESDLNREDLKACERPPDSASPSPPSLEVVISCEGGASYDPAQDWTRQRTSPRKRREWHANMSPKDFYTLCRAPRHVLGDRPQRPVVEQRPPDPQPAQVAIPLEQAEARAMPTPEAQTQLAHLKTQIWRRPPTDPKQRRTYEVLKRKAAKVERSNPKQAYALRMQARALETVSELLITATSSPLDEQHQAEPDRRQVDAAPVASGRLAAPVPGIRLRPRLVNVTTTQSSSTSAAAGAALGTMGGRLHAHQTNGLREVDEIWLSAKRREIVTLERQGQYERAEFLRRVLGL